MANVPYNEGVPSVTPTADVPNDYQTSHAATAEAFGSAKAQGFEQLGQGALTAGKFFGQVAADDASNQYQDFATKLLHGDPNKKVPGPDGQQMPDTGYMGTKGRATLDQRPQVEKALDDKLQEIRKGLTTPEQQLQFDNFSRRYRQQVAERVGSHADGQATTWYQSVNTSSAKLAMDHISNNFDNPNEVAHAFEDLKTAYVRNVQLTGAGPGDPQYQEAVAAAKRDGLQTQLEAMAVKDPSRALAVLDKNKEIAGVKYDDMANKFRTRAQQQQGFDVGEQALRKTYTTQPASGYRTAALTQAGAPYGVSGAYLQRVNQLENANGVTTENQAGAQGPFQFTRKTAQQYGLPLSERNNFDKSADAAARLAADNRVSLTNTMGRTPTDAELYLAHQQGAEGASKLLAHPNVRAGDLVGDAAIRQNGGDPNAPASTFTSMWTAKFNGAPAAAFAQRKAAAYQDILADSSIDPQVRQHALTYVSQQVQAGQIAEEQDAKASKARTDAMQSQFVSEIISGPKPDLIARIAASGLPANEMENLYKFATEQGGVPTDASYGPGYTQAFKAVLAEPNDPSRIGDPATIIARGGPGGDLTKKGVTELLGVMDKIKKQPDQAGIATAKSHVLDYYKNQFAIDQTSEAANNPYMKPYKNPKGLDKFNRDFVPAFEAAYGQWIAAGKNPMEFLQDSKGMDAIMNRIYPASDRAKDAIKGEETGPEKAPPPPQGVEQKSWDYLMSSPPKATGGGNIPLDKWANVLNWLRDNPTPENKAAFDKKMAPSGYTADYVLKRIPPKPETNPVIEKLKKDNAVTSQPEHRSEVDPEDQEIQTGHPVVLGTRG